MKINLSTLKENELRKYSYAKTRDVVEELEKICISDYDGINAIEQIEIYHAFARLIRNRVVNNEFPEINSKNGKAEREHIHTRLNFLLVSFKYSLDIGRLQKRTNEKSEKLNTDLLRLRNQLQATIADYNTKKAELETKVNDATTNLDDKVRKFQERIDESEHTILTHVLTLMGVFSAVITIIMSVVITSSSWLNNADGASAIAAFTIPNLVSILSVIVLLLLVFIYHDAITEPENGRKKNKNTVVFFVVLFCVILLLSCIIGWASVSYKQTSEVAHMQYVLSPSEYKIVIEQKNNDMVEVSFFEFTIESMNYKFRYNDALLHDECLYFCKQHLMLE